MAVYVSPVANVPEELLSFRERKYGSEWAELTADGEDELHFFAWKLGLRYEYRKRELEKVYYRITPAKRAQAVEAGARER